VIRALAVASTVALLVAAPADCKETPGGNSKSLNRRIPGVVESSDIYNCGPGFTDQGIRKCSQRCKTQRCVYTIRVAPDDGTPTKAFDDATRDEWIACTKGKHWPECRD
jgi:hypothetical protein